MPDTGTPGAIEAVIAKSAITDLIAGYAHVIDWLEWDRLDAFFWPDARFDFGMFKGDLGEYRDFVVALEEGYARRLHMFALPAIRLAGDSAQVDVGSVIVCRTDDPAPGIDDTFWGRYLLTAERHGGEWRLSSLTYVLNLFDRVERREDDRSGPMNFGDGLSPRHPFALR